MALSVCRAVTITIVILVTNTFLGGHVSFLRGFYVPTPMVNNLLFTVLALILCVANITMVSFSSALGRIYVIFFFASIKFRTGLGILGDKNGSLVMFLFLMVVLVMVRGFSTVKLTGLVKLSSLANVAANSVPVMNNRNATNTFNPMLRSFNIRNTAAIYATTTAFNLVTNSLVNKPIKGELVGGRGLVTAVGARSSDLLIRRRRGRRQRFSVCTPTMFRLVVTIKLNAIISSLLSLANVAFPVCVNTVVITTVVEGVNRCANGVAVRVNRVGSLNNVYLSLFLNVTVVALGL